MNKDMSDLMDRIGTKYLEPESIKAAKPKESDTDHSSSKMWGVRGDVRFGIQSAITNLEPGTYEGVITMSGPILIKKDVITDDLVDLPDKAISEIYAGIKEFWDLEEKFKTRGFIHKRGILLYGPQGGGKSTLMYKLMKLVKEHKGVSLIPEDPYAAKACISMIRSIEPDLPLLVCMEDIDDIVMSYGDRGLTSLLDGDNNCNNVLYFATTNYPERLPPRLLNRPSRFDIVKYIGLPTAEARKIYLQVKAPDLSPSMLEIWVEKTDNFSIPQLKELIISNLGFGIELDQAIENIRKMGNVYSSNRFEKPGQE